ncbi:MAG TPA: hypothetical protein VEQ85_07830, partial [Lacipirellulaceae bacterium]|nr:hypothetical protein [Lacipirellulaceae bacterium]
MALPATAVAQPGPAINGIRSNLRVFNDFTTTTLVAANTNSVNLGALSTASVSETGYTDDGL